MRRGQEGWQRPEGNKCKVNFDIALDTNKLRLGLAVIVRNNNGDIMAALCSQKRFVVSPSINECYTL